MKVRIGIDVGGTFTDAVIIDNDTFKLIGSLKIPTSHTSCDGVASGIIDVIQNIMAKYKIDPKDVVFIAHGTTQATNALLEGDVVPVGIIGMGQGLEGLKAKADTQVGDIELAPSRYLHTVHRYIDTARENDVGQVINELKNEGCDVIVASAAFAVDNPSTEISVVRKAVDMGMISTGSHEISKLYGLKIRTRTAAINASILPKMMDTASMTESSVKKAGIKAPLMIMRCDGGVMDINEVRKRPILTMLSGPAAGVAGALMYEKVSDGIFLEVGGTSTDISAIKNGKVMVEYAEVGGHKTYLNSLDVRTVGVAGGSMIQIGENGVIDVGPRSAHIAGLKYAVYTKPEDILEPRIVLFQPKAGDPDYAVIKCADGSRYAVTVSCAANILGFVKPGNYSYGNVTAARKAFEPFARKFNISVEKFAEQILCKAAEKNEAVVKSLISDYKLDISNLELIGGGGGAAAIVPHLAKHMGLQWRIAENAEVISPIGVALAMIREVIERTISNPTPADILKIRKEAEQAAINSGAVAESIELHVEVDSTHNIVRVIATGATEFRTKDLAQERLSKEAILEAAAKSINIASDNVKIAGTTGDLYIIEGTVLAKKLFGLLKKVSNPIRVVDSNGIVRIKKSQGRLFRISLKNFLSELDAAIEQCTIYSDGGKEIPDVFLMYGKKVVDLSGLIAKEQIVSVAELEVNGLNEECKIYALISSKSKNAGG